MTSPSGRSPFVPAAVVTALLAVASWVLALVRPWGDTGVTADGSFDSALPVGHLVWSGVVALTAVVVVAFALRGGGDDDGGRRSTRWAGVVVVVLGAVALTAVLAVTMSQAFPRDGGWWAILSAATVGLTGVLLVAATVVRPAGPRSRWATRGVAVAVPLAAVVAGAVVAPGWADHVVDSRHPAVFSETPGPATVTRVGWREDFGGGALSAVLGGRLVVARSETGDRGCRLTVEALDAGTGEAIWTSARTIRCNGPALAALDGNNTSVRVVLRGPATGDRALTGAPTTLWFATEDGRPRTPAAALDAVQWWTEGFGLVAGDGRVSGLDAVTGVTLWSRDVPRCADGTVATLQLPDAPAAGTAVARTPYDTPDAVAGTLRVAGVATDQVLALACGALRQAWFVDVLGAVGDDRVVTLPAAGGPAPTTFLPWLDTVVAVVPSAAGQGGRFPVSVVGLDRASGRVLWTRPPTTVASADVSPVDGSVSVSTFDAATVSAAVQTLDVRTGTVTRSREDAFALASVALTASRVEYGAGPYVLVVDPTTGERQIPLTDCGPVPGAEGAAPLLPGPGGVVVRCSAGQGAVGLVP